MKYEFNWNIFISALMIAVAIFAGLILINTDKKSDYITVSGQSEVPILPDSAMITFRITSLDNTSQLVESENTQKVQDFKDALKKLGVIDSDIQTSGYYLDKREDWSEAGPIDKGYQLMHTLKVITSIGKTSEIIKTGVESSGATIDIIEFPISRVAQDKAVAESMKVAAATAKNKAQIVASSQGLKIGRVLKLEEGNYWITTSNSVRPNPADIPEEYINSMIAPQNMVVEANVNMVFEVK